MISISQQCGRSTIDVIGTILVIVTAMIRCCCCSRRHRTGMIASQFPEHHLSSILLQGLFLHCRDCTAVLNDLQMTGNGI